jgi:hypothetical protein
VTALYAWLSASAAALGRPGRNLLRRLKFMSPDMGTEPLTKALVVVIFGGIANITGPILAAYIIGLFEAVSIYYVGFYWTPALLFAVLIVVLMVRPEGLFARSSGGSHEALRIQRELGGCSRLAVLAILPVFIQDTYLRHLLIMIFVLAWWRRAGTSASAMAACSISGISRCSASVSTPMRC